jgi:hypothetical protein
MGVDFFVVVGLAREGKEALELKHRFFQALASSIQHIFRHAASHKYSK